MEASDHTAASSRSEWLRAMTSPFAYYREAESDRDALRELPARLGLFVLTLGSFVSLTTAGRLVPAHFVGTGLAWAFLPALQALAVFVALKAGRSRARFVPAYSRYLAGHGPWMLFFMILSGVCLFARDVASAFRALLASNALLAALLVVVASSAVSTLGFLLAACEGSRARAGRATAAFYVTFTASVVLWYVGTGALLPLLGMFL